MSKEVAKKNIIDLVSDRVRSFEKTGELVLHKDYSAQNALKGAYLILKETVDAQKKPVLESCSKESVASALLEMVTQGLTPVKKQGYFVPYAGKLQWQRSYFGDILIAKRDAGVKEVTAQAVFVNDEFHFNVDFVNGTKRITKHEQTLDSISNNIEDLAGAYAVVTMNDGSIKTEVMNIDQIKAAWNKRKANGLSPAHKEFPDQMACKTVIKRALKVFSNSSDDSTLYDMARQNVVENANTETVEVEAVEVETKLNADGEPF